MDSSLQDRKTTLVARVIELLNSHDSIKDDILERKHRCATIITKQVLINRKFADFHDYYREIDLSWPVELHQCPLFVELLDKVKQLSDALSPFETRCHDAMDVLGEKAAGIEQKRIRLDSMFSSIMNATGQSQLDTLEEDLFDFDWIDITSLPDIELLEEEWEPEGESLFREISLCLLEIMQLFNTPIAVLLTELEYMYDRSSSSPDSIGSGPQHLTSSSASRLA